MTGSDYNGEITTSIKFQCWLQAKHVNNLRNNDASKKRVEEGYDTCNKFYYIWKFVFHSMKVLAQEADLELCGDKTSWSTASYGDAGAGVTGRVKKKSGVTKGGQNVLISNVNHIKKPAYVQRHKLKSKPPGWTVMGNIEMKNIMKDLKTTIKEESRYRKIFKQHPNSNLDNQFSGGNITDWLVREVFGGTFICRIDSLPIPLLFLFNTVWPVLKRKI